MSGQPHVHPQPGPLDERGNCPGCATYVAPHDHEFKYRKWPYVKATCLCGAELCPVCGTVDHWRVSCGKYQPEGVTGS